MSGDKVSLVPVDAKTVTLVTQDMLERLSERVDRLERALDVTLGVLLWHLEPIGSKPLTDDLLASCGELGRRFRGHLK